MRFLNSAITRVCLLLRAVLICSALMPGAASALSMTFISPGNSSEPFWIVANQNMQAAAGSLGIELEILTSEREYLAQISLTREVSQRPLAQRPDYLIVVAEKGTLAAQLALADQAGIPVFLAFNTVRPEERSQVGYPREQFPLWLGSLVPEAEDGGYLSARALILSAIERVPVGSALGMVALSGDKSTDTSLKRNQGMLRAVAEFPQVKLHQQVFADWSYDKATEQADQLFRRYPEVQLVWSASDLLAFGAMQALRDTGRVPGHDVLFSAVNATPAALQALQAGELTALAGGHHMAGAWAMVMLYDHYHGLDFIQEGGRAEQAYPMFSLLDGGVTQALIESQTNKPADFCAFSRVCNPARTHYDFSFDSWLELNE